MRKSLEFVLESSGHSIELEATSMPEARDLIAGLEPGVLDIAVVDGNLSSNDLSGRDGEEITGLLHDIGGITVIGHSGSGDVVGADINVPKDTAGAALKILDYIAGLPGPHGSGR